MANIASVITAREIFYAKKSYSTGKKELKYNS